MVTLELPPMMQLFFIDYFDLGEKGRGDAEMAKRY